MKELIASLEQIANETDGVRLGEPWKRNDKSLGAIVPILSEVSVQRTYTMLQEAEKDGKVKIEDTGSISGVKINNTGDTPIFVRQGAIFKGNTQERAASVSYIVDASAVANIEVACVHQSKGISHKAAMSYSGHVAPARVSYSLSRGQGDVWRNISTYSSSLRMSMASGRNQVGYTTAYASKNDDLIGIMESAKQDFDKVIGKVECHESQIGIIVLDETGITGVEFFDHPDSWKSFHETVIKSHAETLTKETKSGIYKLDMAGLKGEMTNFVSKCKHATFRLHNETKDSETFAMKNGMSGEYTLLKGKMIHALILAQTETPPASPPERSTYGNVGGAPLGQIFGYNDYSLSPAYTRSGGNILTPSQSFRAKTSKMGNRTIINVPNDYAKTYSRSDVYVEYTGKTKKR
jgi:hypothetical protein